MEAKFTPPPWRIVKPGDIDANDHQSQWQLCGGPSFLTPICAFHAALGAKQANSTLVEAAPDLLAALEVMLAALRNMTIEKFARGDDKYGRELMAAAIAKARGAV